MIKLKVGLEDMDTFETIDVILPCNIRAELHTGHEYVITDCEDMPLICGMDIYELNSIVDDINSENPGMTVEYLRILADAAGVIDITDKEFLRKVRENEFLFEDLSDVSLSMSAEELGARHIVTKMNLPFDSGITKEMLSVLSDDKLRDYINWEAIWYQYERKGFRVEEDTESEDFGLYLIHWKR